MNETRRKRYATSRKKACQECSNAKAKCDLGKTGCSRCARRALFCVYPTEDSKVSVGHGQDYDEGAELDTSKKVYPSNGRGGLSPESAIQNSMHLADVASDVNANVNVNPETNSHVCISEFAPSFSHRASRLERPSTDVEIPDFTAPIELFCPVNVQDISNRWLNSFVPLPGQTPKKYPPAITAFMYRMLKSYAAVTVRSRRGFPPFVHSLQAQAESSKLPLRTCLELVRRCDPAKHDGEDRSSIVERTLRREMDGIYERRGEYDETTLLSAFQAYMIYFLVLFFFLFHQASDLSFLRQAAMNLQEIACATSRQGLVCTAERDRTMPRWEAWVIAESKRRTLYVMYLFDSLLSAQDGLPTFLGTELHDLPAPSSGLLWKASTRQEWEREYNLHLSGWTARGLFIHELWPVPTDLDEMGVLRRRERVDQWLENVDEFGTMMYAVTSCTHGDG